MQKTWFRKASSTFLAIALAIVPLLSDFAPAANTAPAWVSVLAPSAHLGEVLSYYQGNIPSGKPSSLVILIQDLHFNRSVQHNIDRLLHFYHSKYPKLQLAVEG